MIINIDYKGVNGHQGSFDVIYEVVEGSGDNAFGNEGSGFV